MAWCGNKFIRNSNEIRKRTIYDNDCFSSYSYPKRICSNRRRLEDLANELFYEIFEYLEFFDIYGGFFNLNQRFRNIIINSNFLNQINLSMTSPANFDYYHKKILLPNAARIHVIRLSNPFMHEHIFPSAYSTLRFNHLKTLILDPIESRDFIKLSNHLSRLPELHSLTITLVDRMESLSALFSSILILKKLKYCKIQYQIKDNATSISLDLSRHILSSVQCLIIHGRFPFNSLIQLLSCFPELRHLSIQSLVNLNNDTKIDDLSYYIELRSLKHVSLQLHGISFEKFENIIKQFFDYVEVLRLTTHDNEMYLNAARWQHLIISHMPRLRVFDIDYEGPVGNKYNVIQQFSTSFWIKRKWYFTYKHNRQSTTDYGTFYSSAPYRRKQYAYSFCSDEQLCTHDHEDNFNSVDHLYMDGEIKDYFLNRFPNARQLTLTYSFHHWNDSTAGILYFMMPLEQLTKIVIDSYRIPLERIIQFLCFTPNLRTLKFETLALHQTNLDLIQRNYTFEMAVRKNKVQCLILKGRCSFHELDFIVSLFPRLQYLETGLGRTEICQMIRFLLSKTQHSLYLCINYMPKVCIKEIDELIKSEKLVKKHFMKYINDNIYLWW